MSEPFNSDGAFMVFDSKPPAVDAEIQLPPWQILIVDDDDQVHAVTRLVLRHVQFRNRAFKLISAGSARDALVAIESQPDLALALVDVVMETKTAGLDLVRHIREQLKNRSIRLIMRTGQPGHAPEQNVVIDYEIDAYMAKTEISSQKLVTAIIASLRAYEYITEIQVLNAELEARVAMRTQELEKLAMLDPLTGAGNRRHLEQRAAAEISNCQRAGDVICVMMFDLDHFKKINDTWGHKLGDTVLQQVVKTAKDLLRPSDFLARIGGEEFVILLPSTNVQAGLVIGERIRAAIAAMDIKSEQNRVTVTASFGLVSMNSEFDLNDSMARADAALYQAKQDGRNQVKQGEEATTI
jgi:diguanylate cyclase